MKDPLREIERLQRRIAELEAKGGAPDITGRKRKEEEASRMITVVRDSNDAITIQDFEGKILAWNRGAELMYGYSEEEALHQNIWLLTPPGREEEQKDFTRRMMAGEAITSLETRRKTKDGRILDVWMTVTKLVDDTGKPIGIASTERDITGRKRKEEEASRMITVVRDSNDAITIQDFEGKILAWNRGAELMYGYSEEEALRKNIWLLTPPGREEEQKDFTRRMMSGEAITSLETRRKTKDGRILDVWMTVTKLVDDTGKPIGIASTERDITGRKRKEEALRESETRFRQLAESLPQLVWTCRGDGSCDYLSPQWLEYTGIPEAEQLGFGWLNQTHPDDRDRTVSAWNAAVEAKRTFDVEFRIRRKDGMYRWFKTLAVAFRDGEGRIVKWYGTNTDIDDQRQAEEKLRQTEERFRIAAETSNDVVYEWDLKQSVQWVGKIDEMLGHGPGEFPRTLDGLAASVHPEDWDRVMAAVQAHLEGRAPYAEEYRVRRKDGAYRWWTARGAVARTPDGTPVRWVGTVTDITERKRAEEDIRTLNAELEQRVQLRTAELSAANMELDAFTYTVSHDLRAPLRAADGFSRILLDEYAPQLPAEARRYLGLVRSNTIQMGHLVDDLLMFSRSGRLAMMKGQVHPAALVGEALDLLRGEQAGRNVKITVGELPTCQADRALLKQTFINLLSNALKFTRKRDPAVIEVGCRRENGANVFFVRDNGVGFDMRYVGKLFGVFQRLHRSEDYEGTGVGLAIVERIIRRHGGRVWAEAEPDKGATIYFTLKGEKL